MSVTFRMAGPADAARFETVADDLFDNPVEPNALRAFLNDDRHHIAIAITDDSLIVGFVSAVDYFHPDKPNELWINEVGVSEPWHRNGIGKALMVLMLDHGRSIGCQDAWVLTDKENIAANALYKSVARANDEPPEACVLHSFKLNS